jgi:riboflavin kinase/FMN adenylyltransferase
MRIFRQYHDIPEECRGAVVAMGNFDGFHLGHQTVIAEAGDLADRLGVPLAVLTTEPHPRNFFRPDLESFRLTPFRTKAHHLQVFGVDVLMVLHFDKILAGMPAEQFVLDVLIGGMGAAHVVVGYDYRFGRGRGGGTDVLRWMGGMEGFGVTVMQPVMQGGVQDGEQIPYSSSLIREALQNGEPRQAATLLGHWWSVEGLVLHGDKRGGTIGCPTLNLSMEEYLKPKLGVYAVRAVIGEGAGGVIYNGVANIGRRPTFDKTEVILEAHLFDYAGDLYGAHAQIEIVDFIRAEAKFDGLASLKAQIAEDCESAREMLARPGNRRGLLMPPRLPGSFRI